MDIINETNSFWFSDLSIFFSTLYLFLIALWWAYHEMFFWFPCDRERGRKKSVICCFCFSESSGVQILDNQLILFIKALFGDAIIKMLKYLVAVLMGNFLSFYCRCFCNTNYRWHWRASGTFVIKWQHLK